MTDDLAATCNCVFRLRRPSNLYFPVRFTDPN